MIDWVKILHHIERRVNPHSFNTWFRPTRLEGSENGKLVIRVPTRLFRKRLTETYGELLRAVLNEVGTPDTRLEFVCSEADAASSVAAASLSSGGGIPAVKQTRLDFDSGDRSEEHTS